MEAEVTLLRDSQTYLPLDGANRAARYFWRFMLIRAISWRRSRNASSNSRFDNVTTLARRTTRFINAETLKLPSPTVTIVLCCAIVRSERRKGNVRRSA